MYRKFAVALFFAFIVSPAHLFGQLSQSVRQDSLFYLLGRGNTEEVERYLRENRDLINLRFNPAPGAGLETWPNRGRMTPLEYAIYRSNLPLIRSLRGLGASIDVQSLYFAARYGSLSAINHFIRETSPNRAQLDEALAIVRDEARNVSRPRRDFGVVAVTLVTAGAAPQLGLIGAIEERNDLAALFMLQRGANPFEPGVTYRGVNKTPLLVAAEMGNRRVISEILNRPNHARERRENLRDFEAALYAAATAPETDDSLEVVQSLLRAEIEPDAGVARGGRTPLMDAAYTGNERIVRLLIRSGADVSANFAGKTVLDFASDGINYHRTRLENARTRGVGWEEDVRIHEQGLRRMERIQNMIIDALEARRSTPLTLHPRRSNDLNHHM